MPILHIYGASGSGTTTLGRTLQEQLGYTQLDREDYLLPSSTAIILFMDALYSWSVEL